MPADEAIAVLIEEGFTDVSTVDRASDEVPEGLVIGTDPPAGSVVDPATTITVEVSTGIETTMPDVVGLEPGAATDILQALGLEVIEAEVEVESGAPETGLVVSTNPGAGEVVPNDLTVTIVVAVEGDEPPGPPIVDLERSTTTIPPTTRRLTGP
jgi:serine/threonine-protein kinase